MNILKLEIEDSIFDKVMIFLKGFKSDEIRIRENQVVQKNSVDFIEYLTSNPVNCKDEQFLSRKQANER